jgi:hypothetical protein
MLSSLVKKQVGNGIKIRTMFYEYCPYDVAKLNFNHQVFDLSINNYQLTQRLGFEPPLVVKEVEEDGDKKRNNNQDSVEDAIITRHDSVGNRSRCVLNRTTGIVTMSIAASGSTQLHDVIDMILSIYPELGPNLRLVELGTLLRMNCLPLTYMAANCLPRSPLSNMPLAYQMSRQCLLEPLMETSDEEQVKDLMVVLFVRDRDSGIVNAVNIQGLPHFSFERPTDRLADLIERVQPLFSPTSPQLSECTPAFITHTSVAFYIQPDTLDLPFSDLKEKAVKDQSDYHSSIAGLGFEFTPVATQGKRYKKAAGIRIDC